MQRRLVILFTLLTTFAASTHGNDLTAAAIRALLIKQSIARYPGNCPCPYNFDRAGHSCGARSAYSKQGGHAPLCFDSDVTDEMIARFRAKN